MSLNVLSYNCHGLENKVLQNDFFQFIKTSDIFVLLETHITEDKVARFKKYSSGYDTYWKAAVRNSKFGRAIAGCVYGVKRELKKYNISYEFNVKEDIELIIIKTSMKTINIMPLYLRAATWYDSFELVKHFLTNEDVENLVLIGDLNIRIGNEQQYLDEFIKSTFKAGFEIRKSKDPIVEAKGKAFLELCQDFGLHIMCCGCCWVILVRWKQRKVQR